MTRDVDKILLGVAFGALVLRALRGADVGADIEQLRVTHRKATGLFDRMARTAIGCRQTPECECAICEEQRHE